MKAPSLILKVVPSFTELTSNNVFLNYFFQLFSILILQRVSITSLCKTRKKAAKHWKFSHCMKNRKNFFKFFTQVTRISLTPGDNAAECVLKCDWLSYSKSHVDWSIQTIYLTIFPPFFNAFCAQRARVLRVCDNLQHVQRIEGSRGCSLPGLVSIPLTNG